MVLVLAVVHFYAHRVQIGPVKAVRQGVLVGDIDVVSQRCHHFHDHCLGGFDAMHFHSVPYLCVHQNRLGKGSSEPINLYFPCL